MLLENDADLNAVNESVVLDVLSGYGVNMNTDAYVGILHSVYPNLEKQAEHHRKHV